MEREKSPVLTMSSMSSDAEGVNVYLEELKLLDSDRPIL
jgi:hypothetical protein